MAQMMQIIMRLSREKGVAGDISSVNAITRVKGVTKGSLHFIASPVVFETRIPHPIPLMENAILETYPPPATPMTSE